MPPSSLVNIERSFVARRIIRVEAFRNVTTVCVLGELLLLPRSSFVSRFVMAFANAFLLGEDRRAFGDASGLFTILPLLGKSHWQGVRSVYLEVNGHSYFANFSALALYLL